MSTPIAQALPAADLLAARGRGGIREVAGLAWPVMLQTVAETLMALVDSAMVGRLGAASLGAVGFASLWIWTCYAPFVGTASGVQTFVSRADGAGHPEQCGRWIWQAIWALLPVAVAWAGVIAFALPALFTWIDPSPQLLGAARAYVWTRALAAPAIVVMFALMSFFRGVGDTRTPLVAVLISQAVNLVLAYGLVFGRLGLPQLGVMGAGLAMTAASWVLAGVLLAAVLRRSVRERYRTLPVRPRSAEVARFLRTSAPIGGQWGLDLITFAIFGSIVARMGDAAMAASQAMLQMLSISFMQAVAIGVATGTLIGRSIGAQDLAAAERCYRSGQLLACALACAVALLFVGAPDLLIGVFSGEADVRALARPLLALGALFQLIDAVGIVAGHSLRGAGDTRWPFAVQASLAWSVRLPAVYAGAIALGGGVFGAWAGELFYVCVVVAAFLLRFRAGHWRAARI